MFCKVDSKKSSREDEEALGLHLGGKVSGQLQRNRRGSQSWEGRDEEGGGRKRKHAFAQSVREINLQCYNTRFFIRSIILSQSGLSSPVFFPMLPVIPAECPFWPPISCIDCRVCEVGGGGLYRLLSAQVLTDGANVLEPKRFMPTQHPPPRMLNSGEILPTVGFFFLESVFFFLRCWHSRLNCLECCFQ